MSNDRATILSSPTYTSPVLSDEPSSIFDSSPSTRSISDTATIFSTTKTPRKSSCLVQTQFDPPATAHPDSPSIVSPKSARSADSSTTTPTTPKPKSTFTCCFCREAGITKTCTRKNDLKRHIEDFHHTDVQWVCRYPRCRLVFDWQTAYKAHLKAEHGGSRMASDEARVGLCPQVVFACGFDACSLVLEAADDADAPAVFKDYVAHVVKHFDDGAPGEWTYSRRVENLLSQSQVRRAWASCGLDAAGRSKLAWDPQASSVLRKRLECRHVADPVGLVRYAVALGSGLPPPPDLHPDLFVTPLMEGCAESGSSHRAGRTAQDGAGQYSIRVPRGSNPALAQYLNAQRKAHGSRGQARRRTTHGRQVASTPTSALDGLAQYSLMNSRVGGSHYDALSGMYGSGSFSMAEGVMNSQSQEFMGGMRTASPEADISMADSACSLPSLSMPYGVMQQSRTPDVSPHGMEQAGSYYQHQEGRQNGSVMSGNYLDRSI